MRYDVGMEAQSFAALIAPYKQTAIARAVGVDIGTVGRWYRGYSLPRPQNYVALSRFLRLSVEELAGLIAEDSKRIALARVSGAA